MPKSVPKRRVVRRRTPKEPEAVESQFRSLLEAAPDAMVVVDQAGKIVFVNSQTERLFGCRPEEMLGRDVEVIVPVRLREQHRHHRMDFFADPHIRPSPVKMQLFALRKDGTEFPVEISLSPVKTAEGFLVTSAIRDVSERKAEEESRFRLAAIVESSDDAIASVNPDGVIVSWNAGAQRIFGYTEAEALGKSVTMLVPPELPHEESEILERLRTGGSIEHFETVRVTKTGKRINVSLSISPIKDSTGQTVGFSGITRDITERKLAEQTLRTSEERLRLAQQAARIGTFEWNIQTGVNTWTPELEAMYGLPPGGFGGTQAAFESLVHPDDRAAVIQLDRWGLKTGQPTQGEWRVIWPDGSTHWIAGRWQVFMNESGEPSRMVGINMDITDRKRAEQELATANERLHLAIESGSVGGWDFNLGADRNIWFGKAHAQLGMASDETLGSRQEFWDHVHVDDREHLRHAIRLARDTHKEFTEDFRVVWRDGTTHWLRSRGRYQYSPDGRPERILGMSVDITEGKQAEEALRESEQRFRLAAETGKMYSFDWDVTTDIVVRSPHRIKVLGAGEPLRFSHQQFVDTIHPDDRPKFISTIAELTPENPIAEVMYRVPGPDGAFVWLRSSGRAFFDGEGRMLRVVGMVADITDLKRAEEALAAMTRKLIESQEQERARIARELHDDINQRLAMLAIEIAQVRENPSEVENRAKELQDRIGEISHDVEGLAHDLHSSKLEYLGVVAGIKGWCREFAERQNVEIDFSSIVVSVLPREVGLSLLRVLQEALHNAIKYSGVRRIQVELRERSDEIHLIVSDLGRGFDLEAALQGKGLGLTSMRERARLVNGTISIESKPMGGTSIHVCVPLESERGSQRATG